VVDDEVEVDVLDDEVDDEVDDVVDVLELVLVVMLEVDVELVVDEDEELVLVVVGSGHHSICGSMAVASCRQSAAAAESSRISRSICPVTRRQNWSCPSSTAVRSGFASSPWTTTEVSVTSQSGKAGMALLSASTSPASVKSSQHGHWSSGTVVLDEVDVELLVLLELVEVDVELVVEVLVELVVELLELVEVDVELVVEVDEDVEVVVV